MRWLILLIGVVMGDQFAVAERITRAVLLPCVWPIKGNLDAPAEELTEEQLFTQRMPSAGFEWAYSHDRGVHFIWAIGQFDRGPVYNKFGGGDGCEYYLGGYSTAGGDRKPDRWRFDEDNKRFFAEIETRADHSILSGWGMVQRTDMRFRSFDEDTIFGGGRLKEDLEILGLSFRYKLETEGYDSFDQSFTGIHGDGSEGWDVTEDNTNNNYRIAEDFPYFAVEVFVEDLRPSPWRLNWMYSVRVKDPVLNDDEQNVFGTKKITLPFNDIMGPGNWKILRMRYRLYSGQHSEPNPDTGFNTVVTYPSRTMRVWASCVTLQYGDPLEP